MRIDTGSLNLSRLDLLGAITFAGVGVWTLVASAGRPANPEGFLLGLFTVAAAYVVGRIAGTRAPFAACAGLAGAVALVFLLSPDALSGASLAEPLGYGNANGALAAQAVGAACLAALTATDDRRRGEMQLLSVLLVLGAFATRSLTAVLGALAIVLVGLVAGTVRRRGPVVVVGASCVLLVALGTGYLGADSAPEAAGMRSTAEEGLTQRRLSVWHDAVEITKGHPVRGTGPGTFPNESATVRADSDTRSAHSVWLLQSSEQGLPGLAALAALLLWAYVRLWRSRQSPAVVAIGAVTFTAFAVQASMDYVAEFAAVTAAMALLLGVATAAPEERMPPLRR